MQSVIVIRIIHQLNDWTFFINFSFISQSINRVLWNGVTNLAAIAAFYRESGHSVRREVAEKWSNSCHRSVQEILIIYPGWTNEEILLSSFANDASCSLLFFTTPRASLFLYNSFLCLDLCLFRLPALAFCFVFSILVLSTFARRTKNFSSIHSHQNQSNSSRCSSFSSHLLQLNALATPTRLIQRTT